MSDVEYITESNQHKRRVKELSEQAHKKIKKSRAPALLYALAGSAITVAPLLAAVGRYIAGAFVLACGAFFWLIGMALED